MDARDCKSANLALKSLQVILSRMEMVPEVKHPILLRCTIRLLMGAIEGSMDSKEGVEMLCELYEKGESGCCSTLTSVHVYISSPEVGE